ncbi:hypothetical protein BZA70DRAFT_288042 [Myxozyma melibiosi]|uniref:RRM domain-containing protein n=1 Tax=Myxozyma melibiosi TaxID=54550 RepID=A0ABR1F9Y3_9ASCO
MSQYPPGNFPPPPGFVIPPFPGSTADAAKAMPQIPGAPTAVPPPFMAPGAVPFPLPMMPFPPGSVPPGGPGAFPPPPTLSSHLPPPLVAGNPVGSNNMSNSSNDRKPDAISAALANMPIVNIKFSFLTDPAIKQPTVDEQNRTIFIGEVPDELDDFWLGRVLKTSGEIASWVRIKDSLGKPKPCALVEFESIAALSNAVKVLQEVVIPGVEVEEGEAVEDEENAPVLRKPSKLRITYSDETKDLIAELVNSQSSSSSSAAENNNDDASPTLLDASTIKKTAEEIEELLQTWLEPKSRNEYKEKYIAEHPDEEREAATFDFSKSSTIKPDDEELADLPPEQRAIVIQEITSFRERANQRERERIKREEEVEKQRLARMQEEKMKKSREQQSMSPIPSHHGNSSGTSSRGVTSLMYSEPLDFVKRKGAKDDEEEEEDVLGSDGRPLTDEEIEERRKDMHEDDLEAQFIERERRYMREEHARIANAEREVRREHEDKERYAHNREALLKRYAEWDDDEEADARKEEYYRDRSAWLRARAMFRTREAEEDAREAEFERRQKREAEAASGGDQKGDATGLVDSFLDNLKVRLPEKKEELRRDAGPIRVSFKKEESASTAAAPSSSSSSAATPKLSENKPISIGLATKPGVAKPAAAPFKLGATKLGAAKKADGGAVRRPAALGDDEDEEQGKKRRKLIPLSYDKLKEEEE